MSNKKPVYHVDNIVRIINPEVVQRVGYPLTKAEALDAAEKEYAKEIQAFMATVRAAQADDPYFNSPEYDPRLYGDLVDAMAGYWLRQKGYGGKERKIYTETSEAIRNTVGWRVLSKRTVKTGTYNHGGYSGGWEGEPDYDPPYLANERTHVLLTLEATDPKITDPLIVEIEAANVDMYYDPKISMRDSDSVAA